MKNTLTAVLLQTSMRLSYVYPIWKGEVSLLFISIIPDLATLLLTIVTFSGYLSSRVYPSMVQYLCAALRVLHTYGVRLVLLTWM